MAISAQQASFDTHSRMPAVLELLKPVTWFPPMWALMCGFVSAGGTAHVTWETILLAVLLVGPLVCGTSQAVNDWFDRHVDAINEPGRPIPSGRLPGRLGLYIAIGWTGLSLLVAHELGRWVFVAAVAGLALAWAYSAPPVRLKKNGWTGNAACALCYEGLPWITGAVIVGGSLPDWRTIAVAVLYSAGAHGIMTLNDFKSMGGDQAMGVESLPVQMGDVNASIFACFVMGSAQLAVIALLFALGHPLHASVVLLLLLGQLAMMEHLLEMPIRRAQWYSARGVTLYVLGMLVAAEALRAGLHG
jgi:chlorophyll/bacteriochlorophyll a synthase